MAHIEVLAMSLPGHVQNGVVVFDAGVILPEGTKVTIAPVPAAHDQELVVERRSNVTPPAVTDPVERQRILNEVVARMMDNPLPLDAPKFTRDELHERR